NAGTLVVTNSTFFGGTTSGGSGGNSQNNAGKGGDAAGGAVYATNLAGVSVNNVTFESCDVGSNAGDGGNADGPGAGSSHTRVNATRALENTVVAGHLAAAGAGLNALDPSPDIGGAVNSLGHNLVGSNTGASGLGAVGEQVGLPLMPIDAKLGVLRDNNGAI